MFGRRSDGTLVRNLPMLRRFMPFVSPRRNDSCFYYSHEIEVDAALRLLEEQNRGRPDGRQITLFHLYLRTIALGMHANPEANRFIAGGRLYQRNGLFLTFSAMRELQKGSYLVTVKRPFPPGETLHEMVDRVLDSLVSRRSGKKTQSDKEIDFALLLPSPVIRLGMRFLRWADSLGVLPKSMIDDDPLFASVFVANMGSLGMESGFHHLWEYGTCSGFCVMGRIRTRPDGSRYVVCSYTWDERVADGLTVSFALAAFKEGVENPEKLL
ncbi:MAG TPA: hypothetical protein VFT98_07740 [Myxococcota bacterium]|nr:hypothetical protein [Myxococcota bacterium]